MPTQNRKKSYEKGIMAEKIAANYLRLKGCKILAERYKTKYGEIDIVASHKEFLIAVEVKARDTIESALESITPRSRKRIEQAILHYIAEYPQYCDAAIRFDVIAVAPPFNIHHLDNAWRPEA